MFPIILPHFIIASITWLLYSSFLVTQDPTDGSNPNNQETSEPYLTGSFPIDEEGNGNLFDEVSKLSPSCSFVTIFEDKSQIDSPILFPPTLNVSDDVPDIILELNLKSNKDLSGKLDTSKVQSEDVLEVIGQDSPKIPEIVSSALNTLKFSPPIEKVKYTSKKAKIKLKKLKVISNVNKDDSMDGSSLNQGNSKSDSCIKQQVHKQNLNINPVINYILDTYEGKRP